MISGDFWRLSFPIICLTDEEKPGKILNQENRPDRGLNPGPLRGNDVTPRPQRWQIGTGRPGIQNHLVQLMET